MSSAVCGAANNLGPYELLHASMFHTIIYFLDINYWAR